MKAINAITEKLSPVAAFFKKQALLSSFLLCFLCFMFFLWRNGFNIIAGNDDYCIFRMIYFGDLGIGCVGFFLTSFFSMIQPLCGNLNSYMIFQELACFGSLVAVNYVFISKLRSKSGFFLALILDIFFFSFITLNILFTYTSPVVCTAGLLLFLYASLYEPRKILRIVQMALGSVLMLAGSQLRFDPFKVLTAFFFVTAVCVLIVTFIKNKKETNIKQAALNTLKRFLKTGVSVAVVIAVVFGSFYASNALKHTVKGFDEYIEYNRAVSSVIDHNTVPFYAAKEYYNSIGVSSASDITLLKKWFIDEDYFTAEKLNKIFDYTKANYNDGIFSKNIVAYVLDPIVKSVAACVSDGRIIIFGIILIVLVFAFIILGLLDKGKAPMLIRVGITLLFWSFYFIVTSGFNNHNMLVPAVAVVTLFVAVRYNGSQLFVTLSIASAFAAMYFYLMTYRLFFYVTVSIIFPAIVFMIFALSDGNLAKRDAKLKSDKVITLIVCAVMLVTSVYFSNLIIDSKVVAKGDDNNPLLEEYIDSHPDNIFYINQTALVKHYYNPLILTEPKENIVNYGLWIGKSGYIRSGRERNGIKHMFKDAINSNVLIPLYEFKRDKDNAIISEVGLLEEYYNAHYAEKGEKITLKKVDSAGDYAFYKVVLEKEKN